MDTDVARRPARIPTLFVPHGAAAWPFVPLGSWAPEREVEALRAFFRNLPASLPEPPRALVVVSGHWEEPVPTVLTAAKPPIYYDYYGFPPEAYTIRWPAPGAPAVAERVRALLGAAGIPSAADPARGFDHGTFIPFKVAWPDADVPTLQLSLTGDLDPARHLAVGRALAPLRDEGVLLVGSGMTFHNMRALAQPAVFKRAAVEFDGWLGDVVTGPPGRRVASLRAWATAPSARLAHPREDHLLPLMVVAGAAAEVPGTIVYRDDFLGFRVSGYRFG